MRVHCRQVQREGGGRPGTAGHGGAGGGHPVRQPEGGEVLEGDAGGQGHGQAALRSAGHHR